MKSYLVLHLVCFKGANIHHAPNFYEIHPLVLICTAQFQNDKTRWTYIGVNHEPLLNLLADVDNGVTGRGVAEPHSDLKSQVVGIMSVNQKYPRQRP